MKGRDLACYTDELIENRTEILPTELLVINSYWVPSLPNAPGKDKLWEEASPAAVTNLQT